MSRPPAQIRTTIPPRTMGARQKADTPHALHLRLSYLELERQRRIMETEQAQARILKLQQRIEEIDREKALMMRALADRAKPLTTSEVLAVSRTDLQAQAAVRARGRAGLAIRY